MSEPVRYSYLFLPSYAPTVLYATFFVCGIIMMLGIYRQLRSYGLSLTDVFSLFSKDLGRKLRRFTKYGVGQRKVVQGGSGLCYSSTVRSCLSTIPGRCYVSAFVWSIIISCSSRNSPSPRTSF